MTLRIDIYGQGVTGLKKHTELLDGLADRLSLPPEALAGAAKLSVTAGRHILVENHRGILEYGPERIVVSLGREKLLLSGEGLHLLGMTRRELLIGGTLRLIEWMG